jgi:HSP20 family protein
MASLEDELRAQLADAVDTATHPQRVPVNVYDTDEALVVVAPLPGVMGDDVTVIVEKGRMTIEASMRTAAPKHYLVHEWHYGPYRRELDIPEGFGASAMVSFGNGQLAVHLSRGEATSRYSVRPGEQETSR